MDLILQGLQLSLVGITVTFSALGLFILIILLLQRLFGQRVSEGAAIANEAGAGVSPGAVSETEIAAAIALALEYSSYYDAGGAALGQALTQGRGPWWARQVMLKPPAVTQQPSRSDKA